MYFGSLVYPHHLHSIKVIIALGMAKSRKFSEIYLKMGFTFVLDKSKEKPLRDLCYSIQQRTMKPSKLKHHLQQKHPEHVEKHFDFFQRQKLFLKRQKLDASEYFQEQSTASLTASFEVAYS